MLIKAVKGIPKTKQIKLLSKRILNGKKAKSEWKEKIKQGRQVMKLILRMT